MNPFKQRVAAVRLPDITWGALLLLGALAIGLAAGAPGVRGVAFVVVAVVAAIALVALLVWKTELAVPLMLVAASFDVGGRVISEPFPLTVYQGVLLVGLASWALRLLWGDATVRPRLTLIDGGMLLLLAAALWSLPFSLDPRDTVVALVRLVFIYLFYLMCSTFLRQRWVAEASTATLVGAGVFHALIALAQTSGVAIGNISVYVGGPTSDLRAAAFFDDPNYLAMMLVAAALAAAIRVVHARSITRALPWLAAAALCALGVYVTYSRTGLVGLAVGLIVIWLLAPTGRKRWVFLAGAILVLGLLATDTQAVLGRFGALLDLESEQSAATRYYMLSSTIEIIKDYWIMGTGLSAFDVAYPAYRIAGSSFSVIKPHQLPLALWAEMGIAGLLAEIVLTTAVIRATWRSIRRPRGSDGIVMQGIEAFVHAGDRLSHAQKAGLAIMASFAIGSLFQYYLYVEYLWFGVALFAGSSIAERTSSLEVRHV